MGVHEEWFARVRSDPMAGGEDGGSVRLRDSGMECQFQMSWTCKLKLFRCFPSLLAGAECSHRNLILSLEVTNHTLYSVGLDKIDKFILRLN